MVMGVLKGGLMSISQSNGGSQPRFRLVKVLPLNYDPWRPGPQMESSLHKLQKGSIAIHTG
jgi:hypothetical protein